MLGEGMDVVDATAGVAVTDTTTRDPPLPWPELPLIDGSYLLMFYRVTTAPFRVAQARPIGASFRLDWSAGPTWPRALGRLFRPTTRTGPSPTPRHRREGVLSRGHSLRAAGRGI